MDELSSKSPAPVNKPVDAEHAALFVPRTPLGQRLWELRQKIVESGEPLTEWEDIGQEVQMRRGGRAWPDDD